MTAQQRTAFWTIVGTVAAAGIIGLGSLAWSAKADKADVQRLDSKLQRVLDAVCYGTPTAPVCKGDK